MRQNAVLCGNGLNVHTYSCLRLLIQKSNSAQNNDTKKSEGYAHQK